MARINCTGYRGFTPAGTVHLEPDAGKNESINGLVVTFAGWADCGLVDDAAHVVLSGQTAR